MSDCKTFTEEIKTSAEGLVDAIKDLIHQGNVRHIEVKNAQGQTVFELPVTFGVLGVLLAPTLAAVGAIAVIAADYTIVVTREDTPKPPPPAND